MVPWQNGILSQFEKCGEILFKGESFKPLDLLAKEEIKELDDFDITDNF